MLRVAIARTDDRLGFGGEAPPALIGEDERLRWTSLPQQGRRDFVASRGLLRELLCEATGLPADAWAVSAQAGHPPTARSLQGECTPAPCASLSHRLGWVAAAVADSPVGVDVECVRPSRSEPAERAALMLAAGELSDWQALADVRREPALLTAWTAKEAWFKSRPAGDAPWDFRRVVARACAPAQANVRVWESAPLHVAVCCADAQALAAAECRGLPASSATSSFWLVSHAASAA